jgi:hypothetical protein
MSRTAVLVHVAVATLLCHAALVDMAQAQTPPIAAQPTMTASGTSGASVSTRAVAPGPKYKRTVIGKTFLGSGWRDLWTTPINAPLFDIDTFAGGLKVDERGGGRQTLTLHFLEKEGWRDYVFRSVDKYPLLQAMPKEMQGTLSGRVVQDEVSALLPGAGVLMAPLLDAAGILRVSPGFYVMPDNPKLGSQQDTFANILGTVELNPKEAPDDKPGFAGSAKILSAEKFLELVREKRSTRLDERELFAARLIDFLVNDVDRTRDNIKFARIGEKDTAIWRPIPRDRDHAFMNGGGLITALLVRPLYPKLAKYEPRISLRALTFGSHHIDRRLLQRISRADADSIALRLRGAITNDVIESVIAALPAEWRERTSAPARLRAVLTARRDNLPAIATTFYNWLASEVDLHATNEADKAAVERHEDGRVTVTITGKEESAGVLPFIKRTFHPGETNEVRVYLHDGDDEALVTGARANGVIVRIIGGDGSDALTDAAGAGGTHFYDTGSDNNITPAPGTHVSLKPWTDPEGGGGLQVDSPWRPDWGGSNGWGFTAHLASGADVVVGFGPRYSRQAFRRLPHRIKVSANALWGVSNGKPGADFSIDYRKENSPVALTFDARATQYEEFRFSGFGNATTRLLSPASTITKEMVRIEPTITYQIGWRSREELAVGGLGARRDSVPATRMRSLIGTADLGLVANWTRPGAPADSPFAEEREDGRDLEGRLGGRFRLTLDKTMTGDVPAGGFKLQSEIIGYPAIPGANEAFATASGSLAAYLPLLGGGTHLAFRAGGALASTPDVPLLNAPAIGGRSTLRGYDSRRFTGDRTAYGSAELRVPVGVLPFLIRWNVGVFGLADAGRVWYDNSSPGTWHTAAGGGIWFSTLGQTFSIAYAKGEKASFYIRKGAFF